MNGSARLIKSDYNEALQKFSNERKLLLTDKLAIVNAKLNVLNTENKILELKESNIMLVSKNKT